MTLVRAPKRQLVVMAERHMGERGSPLETSMDRIVEDRRRFGISTVCVRAKGKLLLIAGSEITADRHLGRYAEDHTTGTISV